MWRHFDKLSRHLLQNNPCVHLFLSLYYHKVPCISLQKKWKHSDHEIFFFSRLLKELNFHFIRLSFKLSLNIWLMVTVLFLEPHEIFALFYQERQLFINTISISIAIVLHYSKVHSDLILCWLITQRLIILPNLKMHFYQCTPINWYLRYASDIIQSNNQRLDV